MVFNMRTLSLPRTKDDLLMNSLERFSWKELKLATDNFNSENVVGRGGFASVYKGRLADGSLVAIKRCMISQRSTREFEAELEIGGLQASDHPNILSLRGYCMIGEERLLVYPLMLNTSVHSWLHDRLPSQPPLDWPTRKRIALGAAKGLAHFHCGSSFTAIHRDVKSSNILLDDQFEAILCDFGLVKFIGRNENESNSNWVQGLMEEQHDDEDTSEVNEEQDSDHDNNFFTKSCWNFTRTLVLRSEGGDDGSRGRTKGSCWFFTKNEARSESGHTTVGPPLPTYHQSCSHVTTSPCGTIGYLDPYYFATSKCSVKTDVFGYGITLLELVTGKKALVRDGDADNGVAIIYIWAEQLFQDDRLDMLIDSNLRGGYIKEEMEQLILLALSCTKLDPGERPVMSNVVKIIENIGPIDQLLGAKEDMLKRFTLPQLKLATDNFSSKNIIGESGISNMYRGFLEEDGSTVIVTRLVKRSKRGMMLFQAAVKLGGIRHSNLLQLSGYCISGKESLLVYPFMPNQSLEWRLRPEHGLALDWHARKKIALGIARGISYLHYDYESNVTVGRNVKPYNILLDEDFNPVLCNLGLESNCSSHERDDQELSLDQSDTDDGFHDGNQVDSGQDVYDYGITLFVLISGKVSTGGVMDRDSFYCDLMLHDWFKRLRYLQLELLLDPCMKMGGSNYDTMCIKDEIEHLIQVALLCTQPSPADRPEMCQVMQMLESVSDGDVEVCSALDEPLQPQLFHELEAGAMMDSPRPDSSGSLSTEFDQTNEVQLSLNPKQDINISSKGKQVVSFSLKPTYSSKSQHTKLSLRYKGTTISVSDNVLEPKIQEIWKIFLMEVVSDALPTKSKLCRSGMSIDPLCPLCNKYEEDNFHLFFNCDFSKQAWQLAVGVRIDMLGFGSVKEAVDVILKPDGARLNILPPGVEPTRFTHKSVALMHSIWTHRNQVCFDKVSPNVIQMLNYHTGATDPYCIQPPPNQTQEQFKAGSGGHATGLDTFDTKVSCVYMTDWDTFDTEAYATCWDTFDIEVGSGAYATGWDTESSSESYVTCWDTFDTEAGSKAHATDWATFDTEADSGAHATGWATFDTKAGSGPYATSWATFDTAADSQAHVTGWAVFDTYGFEAHATRFDSGSGVHATCWATFDA